MANRRRQVSQSDGSHDVREGERERVGWGGGGGVSYYLPESCNEAGRKV